MADVENSLPEPVPQPAPVRPIEASGPGAIRASDAERELIVEQLSAACGEGRLTLEELSTRVDRAYTAVSRGELEPLVVDLPIAGEATLPTPAAPVQKKKKGSRIIAIMGSATRSGHWRVQPNTSVVTIMGEAEIDLRQALIEAPELEMKLWLCMGEQRVIVPEGVDVEVTGMVFMGEKRVDVSPVRPRPGVPRLHIKVAGMMGEVRVRTM